MSDRVFVDTNVLIYAHHSHSGSKRAIAQRALAQLWETRTGVLSLQVLQEFEQEAKVSFWDALILTAARKASAIKLLSEDMNAGQTIAGVFVENPFAVPTPTKG